MHRPAHATIEPGIPHENLCKNPGQQESFRRHPAGIADMARNKLEKPAVGMGLENRGKLGCRERPDSRQSLGDDLAMAAVGAENLVLGTKRHGTADGGRLLPNRQVRRPLVEIFDAAITSRRFEGMQHAFEFANHQHVAQRFAKPVIAPTASLGLDILTVGVNGDVAETQAIGGIGLVRTDRKLFRQGDDSNGLMSVRLNGWPGSLQG